MKKYLFALVLTVVSIVTTKAQNIFVFEKDTEDNKYDSTLVVSCELHKGERLYVQVSGFENKSIIAENDTVVFLKYKLSNKRNSVKVGFANKNDVSFESTYYVINYRLFHKGIVDYDHGCECYRNKLVSKGNRISLRSVEENIGNIDWIYYNPKTGAKLAL